MTALAASPQPAPDTASERTERWWHRATGYQVYPRSFADSNGDGMGDIPGVISKLGHLSDLGIGFIWLSPVYASPMIDNGYDIADYRNIAPEFGTLDDMDRLIAEARERGIGIVMDLVVNHSSSLHHWFQAARAARDCPEHDYYIWRDPAPDGGPPDDARAAFGGPAWTFVPEVGQYYFHFFSPAQPDLNWQNPALRAEIHDMMRWWLDRGIAGFRMDVISLIGKDVDGRIYEEGPYLHPFLQEMHREVLAGRDVLTIGESWSVSTDTGLLYCGRDRDELDMVFEFSHIREGWHPELGKFAPKPFDLVAFKRALFSWQDLTRDDGWHALFLSNHDLPRQVSFYADDRTHRRPAAKTLATVLHLLKGTPFVYQGEEIGMTNARFERIDQYRDLETLNHFEEQIAQGVSPDVFLAGANRNSRDHSRTPMQWSAAPHGGFTTGTPWIEANPNFAQVNVERDMAHPDSIFAHYRRLIALRKDSDLVTFGHTVQRFDDDPDILAFERRLGEERLLVIANFTARPQERALPDDLTGPASCLLCTHAPYNAIPPRLTLAPYESLAWTL
ncbi:oligo-1,6-glucosidase [Salipiger aestuarii]|uniref:Oligo-1,6-glucosidase n=1 Tax=Salipiger aestuarii TaxID=568098 RepID=A0A327YF47_9RHOB|nr:alpha-glucosidase [Salipiger aestuarii]KAA8608889.1 oligo-1,6-glucosidase [Salipiger aestuarii]KAA8613193.1 oligo-1,6-glucosidase [Salipiger aestuarii]KAB2543055.1 oligo-1,6-glucosidase [Salipiger aestuarii]RAK19678.1 oligo-1,6-glucosidase [Salipiger aestuarii]